MAESADDKKLPQRQNPSPGVHIHIGRSNFVLLTVTAQKRRPWVANEEVQRLLQETWLESTAWVVGDYLLMPDHLHCMCAPYDLHFSMERWISYWKRMFARKHKRSEWKFQSRGWHHRLRNGESYSEKWLYVQENPIRKNLCKRIEDWRFKGKVFDLIWTGD
jgi:REP element-mobilizing transposase RayT